MVGVQFSRSRCRQVRDGKFKIQDLTPFRFGLGGDGAHARRRRFPARVARRPFRLDRKSRQGIRHGREIPPLRCRSYCPRRRPRASRRRRWRWRTRPPGRWSRGWPCRRARRRNRRGRERASSRRRRWAPFRPIAHVSRSGVSWAKAKETHRPGGQGGRVAVGAMDRPPEAAIPYNPDLINTTFKTRPRTHYSAAVG